MVWRESYTYDRNGNRAGKSTPWGTIRYEYDRENRLIRKGDIVYTNDKDGNVLSEKGIRYEARYEYNGQNRMTYSEVTSHKERTYSVSGYEYDALGRRTITQSVTGQTLRTVYDGKGFEVIREGETFRDGSLTTRYAPTNTITANTNTLQSNEATGERYRWISDSGTGRTISEDGYDLVDLRQGMRGVTLYARGEAVAVSYSSSTGSRSVYLGNDLLGSVRTATTDSGAIEDRYEYDAFGKPYSGDLSGAMNLGYTGKPYDTATGLYNYGYRDYSPQVARFMTVDPIRDGNNWFAYVNNDPVNWIDLWGLQASERSRLSNSNFMINASNTVVSGIVGYDVTKSPTIGESIGGAMYVLSSYTGVMGFVSEAESIGARILGRTSTATGYVATIPFLWNAYKNPSIDSVSTAAGNLAGVVAGFPFGLVAGPTVELTAKGIGTAAEGVANLNETIKKRPFEFLDALNYFASGFHLDFDMIFWYR